MKTRIPASISILMIGFCISDCSKPNLKADFLVKNGIFFTGDTITFFNTSKGAESYLWEFPDGTTSTEKNPNYVISRSSRSWGESVKLTAFSKKRKNSHVQKRDYELYISSQPYEFFKLDSNFRKPYKKFYVDRGDGWSHRFFENEAGIGYPFEGRILIKSSSPLPGEYVIDNDFIKIEMGNTGSGWGNNYELQATTLPEYGGTVTITAAENSRYRIKFQDIKMYDMRFHKTVYSSADLTF